MWSVWGWNPGNEIGFEERPFECRSLDGRLREEVLKGVEGRRVNLKVPGGADYDVGREMGKEDRKMRRHGKWCRE